MHTPVEFGVERSLFAREERCLVLGGAVPAGARVEPGMKVSVAVNRRFALELRIARVERIRVGAELCWIAVWVRAGSRAEAALLAELDVNDELVLVWEGSDPVDPARHFDRALEREIQLALRRFEAEGRAD